MNGLLEEDEARWLRSREQPEADYGIYVEGDPSMRTESEALAARGEQLTPEAKRAIVAAYIEQKRAQPPLGPIQQRRPLTPATGGASTAPASSDNTQPRIPTAPIDEEMSGARGQAALNRFGGHIIHAGQTIGDALARHFTSTDDLNRRSAEINAESQRPIAELLARRKMVEDAIMKKHKMGLEDKELDVKLETFLDRQAQEKASAERAEASFAETKKQHAISNKDRQRSIATMDRLVGARETQAETGRRGLELRQGERIPPGYVMEDPTEVLPIGMSRKITERLSALSAVDSHVARIRQLASRLTLLARIDPTNTTLAQLRADFAGLLGQMNITNATGDPSLAKLELAAKELGGDPGQALNLLNNKRLMTVLQEAQENAHRNVESGIQVAGLRKKGATSHEASIQGARPGWVRGKVDGRPGWGNPDTNEFEAD